MLRWLWRDVGYGLVAAAAAMAAMATVAIAGVQLTAAGRQPTGAIAAAAVVLAAGGPVDLSLGVHGSLGAGGPLPVQGYGELWLRPLGVTLTGAVAFGAALLLPLRRRPVSPARLAVRCAAAAAGFGLLAGLAGQLARGTITVPVATADGPLEVAIGFQSNPSGALAGGLSWALVVLALCWLGAARSPVPSGWRRWRDPLRPVLTAAFAVAVAGSVLVVAGAAAAVPLATDGPALLGGALLTAPTVLLVLVTLGLGVHWTVGLAGPLGERLTARLAELGQDPTLSLGRLAGTDGTAGWGWLVPVAVASLALLGCGVLAAARTPARAAVPAGRRQAVVVVVRAAVMRAGRLGAVLGVAVPALAALARVTLDAGLSVFGREFGLVAARLHTSLLAAVVLGLGGGAAAGFLGSLLVDALRSRARPGAATRRAPGPGSYPRQR